MKKSLLLIYIFFIEFPLYAQDGNTWDAVSAIVSAIGLLTTLIFFGITLNRTNEQIKLLIESLKYSRRNLDSLAFLDIYKEWMSQELIEARTYVTENLQNDYPNPEKDANDGYKDLQYGYRDLKENEWTVRKLSYFFDKLGLMVATDLIDSNLIISFWGTRICQTYEILEPYILKEKELRKEESKKFTLKGSKEEDDFQDHFKDLAELSSVLSQNVALNIQRATKKRKDN